jgi:glutathione S-transferase
MKQFGLDFDEVRIPLDTPDFTEKIQQYSPSGKVPVLTHDMLTVWETLAICEYLAEQFPCYTGGRKIKQPGRSPVPLVQKCIQVFKICARICQ